MARDGRYTRCTFTFDPESAAPVAAYREATGKSASEVVRLSLLSMEGNYRLVRHALNTPLQALRLHVNLLAALATEPKDQSVVELLAVIVAEQFRRIDAVLAPALT